jgi:hypothetical protein
MIVCGVPFLLRGRLLMIREKIICLKRERVFILSILALILGHDCGVGIAGWV